MSGRYFKNKIFVLIVGLAFSIHFSSLDKQVGPIIIISVTHLENSLAIKCRTLFLKFNVTCTTGHLLRLSLSQWLITIFIQFLLVEVV